MTEKEYETMTYVKNRIEQLEREIYALLDIGRNTKITPIKKILSVPIRKGCWDEQEIELTLSDVRSLQNLRQNELDALRKIMPKE